VRWFLLIYTVNSSELNPVQYKICALIPSHIYCNQLKVFSILAMKFIMRCVMTKVRDKFSRDATGGILFNFWYFLSSLLVFLLLIF
jgi:hypothetical protein